MHNLICSCMDAIEATYIRMQCMQTLACWLSQPAAAWSLAWGCWAQVRFCFWSSLSDAASAACCPGGLSAGGTFSLVGHSFVPAWGGEGGQWDSYVDLTARKRPWEAKSTQTHEGEEGIREGEGGQNVWRERGEGKTWLMSVYRGWKARTAFCMIITRCQF